MFSTSITASSTTSPMAIERPPNVIVFRLKPILSSAITAASRESGIVKVQHSRAQIEAVEHDISDNHDGDEHKPYRFHSQLLTRTPRTPRKHWRSSCVKRAGCAKA